MEPDTYGGLLNSTSLPPTLIHPPSTVPPPSISSSNAINYEIRSSSSRRHHHKQPHDNHDERIEVKILPQDDNWGETTTTTYNIATEDITINNDTNLQLNDPIEHLSDKLNHQKRSILIYHFLIYFLCLIAFISPILFLTLPYTINRSELIPIDDYTLLLTIIFKLLFLLFGTFLLLYRRRNTIYLPCIHIQKVFLMIILTIILFTYWLYYILKLLQPNVAKYEKILSMTSTYEDLLIFLLLLVVIILEVKWLYPKWIVKIVRSPDGQTRQYTIGKIFKKERISL
jgi:vang-like